MPEDQHDDQHDVQHAEQDRVRRLLADLAATDAAHPTPVPDDVAGRLDVALREAARATSDPTVARPLAPVVPLRRRWAPALVAAAAVVVVGGIGVAAVTQSSGDSAMSQAGGSASDSSAESSESSESLDAPSAGAEAQQDSTEPGTMSQSAPTEEGDADLGSMSGDSGRMLPAPYLTLGGFADGVATLVAQGQVATGADAVVDADELRRVQGSGCVVPDPADGAATLVSLEGDPAVLVVAPPADGRQQVEVRSCAAGEALAQSEVTAVG